MEIRGRLGRCLRCQVLSCPNWVSPIREEAEDSSKVLNLVEHTCHLGTGMEEVVRTNLFTQLGL